MDYQDSPASSQGDYSTADGSPGSPASPENPGPTTLNQDWALEALNSGTPQNNYSWNNRSLLERNNFGGKVYRADQRAPAEVLLDGYNASEEFTAVKKMISGDALTVSETLEGALEYAQKGGRTYYFYEIDATHVTGASLLENYLMNNLRTLEHLSAEPGQSPSNQTGLANDQYEAHLNHDDLTGQIRSLGNRDEAEEYLRTMLSMRTNIQGQSQGLRQ